MNWVGRDTPLRTSKDHSLGPLPTVGSTLSPACLLPWLLTGPVLGVEELCPSSEGYFAFYDPECPTSVMSALDDLDKYVAQEGPYDGVMGFSQGAALAAMLIIRHHSSPRGDKDDLFRLAVFICGAVPHKEAALRRGMVEFLDPTIDGQPVKMPSTNIVGGKDPHICNGITLGHLCQERGKVVFDHGGGHEIPRHPKEITGQMAQAIVDTIQKALFVQ